MFRPEAGPREPLNLLDGDNSADLLVHGDSGRTNASFLDKNLVCLTVDGESKPLIFDKGIWYAVSSGTGRITYHTEDRPCRPRLITKGSIGQIKADSPFVISNDRDEPLIMVLQPLSSFKNQEPELFNETNPIDQTQIDDAAGAKSTDNNEADSFYSPEDGIDYSMESVNHFTKDVLVRDRTHVRLDERRLMLEVSEGQCWLIVIESEGYSKSPFNKGDAMILGPNTTYYYQTLGLGDCRIREVAFPDKADDLSSSNQV